MPDGLRIVVDDLSGKAIARFLQAHLDQMRATSPPESVHALDLDGLRRPEVTFWTLLDGDEVVGCGALKELDARHAEVKSMRTDPARRRQGLATTVLRHVIEQARARGYERLWLETGSQPFFAPARALYAKHGFVPCAPFADYTDDPNSSYFTLALQPAFATAVLPADPTVVAPDGSDVRVLLALPAGGMAHFELAPGAVTVAVRHRTVSELWYVVGGAGELWRRDEAGHEDVAALGPGTCASIPLGTSFQFRAADGDVPLQVVAATMPPWPGDDEAYPVPGRWGPTV